MILVVEYDRKLGRTLQRHDFPDADRATAEAKRLEIELENHRAGILREVVTLRADSEDQLRRTHQRYFRETAEDADVLEGLLAATRDRVRSRR